MRYRDRLTIFVSTMLLIFNLVNLHQNLEKDEKKHRSPLRALSQTNAISLISSHFREVRANFHKTPIMSNFEKTTIINWNNSSL